MLDNFFFLEILRFRIVEIINLNGIESTGNK